MAEILSNVSINVSITLDWEIGKYPWRQAGN